MNRLLLFIQLLLLGFCCSPGQAENDAILQALVDEMDRSTKSLHLDSHPLPYFVSYKIEDVDQLTCFSCLGSKADMQHDRERQIMPIVRIGSYDLDNSFPSTDNSHTPYFSPITVDDDYTAIRRGAWLVTDRQYKRAINTFEWKKAFLAENSVQDRLPDRTREVPITSIAPSENIEIDSQKWCTIVEKLSAIFKKYPSLQKSKVAFIARTVTNWYVNSEGSRIKHSRHLIALTMWATAQAPDGMLVMDHDAVASSDEKTIPEYSEMERLTENVAKRVCELRLAPKADEYCGPVLFEKQGAAELLSQVLAPNFDLAEEYTGSYERWRNPFTKAIGRRVLPKFLSVIDDPQAKEYKGVSLVGGYKFDDDGVPGQKIQLVENGMLRGFCQSRVPTRNSRQSNGHSLCGLGVHSILQMTSSKTVSPEELKSQITELAKDAGLDYILVIARLCDCHSYQFEEPKFEKPFGNGKIEYDTPAYSTQPTDPILAYRLYLSDGHRELVRGLEFRDVSLSAFRDIQAVLDDAAAYLVEPADHVTRHIVTPSYLVHELALTPVKPEHSSPPSLPSPLIIASPNMATNVDGK